ncbi:hypothetical protein TSOC_002201 [Tetrabaena socialis]|uniref:SAP domain-containing protein n=1 Tax=Tetrabaena socialis TaxID=47790 RepID=A0A2J8AER9_9CHLO|nr:hypothetical protein TSOC_002201 [Tetrabaena socialis]|eukprot:PNH10996.1 hypothetical protein TSOC_002201 [Tetrabaena socialis]
MDLAPRRCADGVRETSSTSKYCLSFGTVGTGRSVAPTLRFSVGMTPTEVERLLRPLCLKDLRTLLRLRGLSPAGGKDQMEARLKDHMLASGNFSTHIPADGAEPQGAPSGYAVAPQGYQQMGNFDRPPSHAMAPPGGHSSVQLGGYSDAPPGQYRQQGGPPPQQYGSPMPGQQGAAGGNNYSRPGGQQNVGNFITDRPSSRVLAPPGGASQISFGEYNMPAPSANPRHFAGPSPPPYGVAPPHAPPSYGFGSPAQAMPPGLGAYPGGPRPGEMGRETNVQQNNYSRPNGQQNVGNFITDRPSSRVLAPPGGKSQITFG